jgi:hypothetical protein
METADIVNCKRKKSLTTTPSRHIYDEVQLHPLLISALDGSGQHHARPLYALEITLAPNEKEAGMAPESDWTFWRRDISVAPAGI